MRHGQVSGPLQVGIRTEKGIQYVCRGDTVLVIHSFIHGTAVDWGHEGFPGLVRGRCHPCFFGSALTMVLLQLITWGLHMAQSDTVAHKNSLSPFHV